MCFSATASFTAFAVLGVIGIATLVRGYGVLNVIGLDLVKGYAFASVWCFYAAVMSVVLYRQFHRQDIDVGTPNGTSAVRQPFVLA